MCGEQAFFCILFSLYADHPRVCGEQLIAKIILFVFLGSPPRVRGTVATLEFGEAGGGITPACAGNSSMGKYTEQAKRDHPRVCGEQLHPVGVGGYGLGSPPRVRGTAGLRQK